MDARSINRIAIAAVLAAAATPATATAASKGLTVKQANRHVLNHLADVGYGPNESFCASKTPYHKSGRTRHKVLTCPFLAFRDQAELDEDDTSPDCSGQMRVSWSARKPGFKLRLIRYTGCGAFGPPDAS